MEERITPEELTDIPKGFIFVFGSNEAGIHAAGAAKFAMEYGARLGQGYGMMAQTFAIPTKDWQIEVLPLNIIEGYVKGFERFVNRSINTWNFYVTRIGCGLAGYTPEQIAPMFQNLRSHKNVWLPQEFIEVIDKKIENESKHLAGRTD